MGAEANTTLLVGQQRFKGKALLEGSELLFRGETRLRVPLSSITALDVRDGTLHVAHADGLAVFELGEPTATRWAQKLRSPRTLAQKLGITSGMRVALLGVTDEGLLGDIERFGAQTVRGKVPAGTAIVLWRIDSAAQLTRLPSLAKNIVRDGAIWAVHARGNASVADTVIFAAAKAAGLTYTKVVRFSDTHTAEKLVIPKTAR